MTPPNSITYAGGNLFLKGISEEKNYPLLKYYDIGNEKTVFTEFLSGTDIPDKYKPSDSLSSTLRIKDPYVSEDRYMYYCGEVSEWKNRETNKLFSFYFLNFILLPQIRFRQPLHMEFFRQFLILI